MCIFTTQMRHDSLFLLVHMPRLKEIIHYGSPFPKQHEREREIESGIPKS
jgi:hypothetical protein